MDQTRKQELTRSYLATDYAVDDQEIPDDVVIDVHAIGYIWQDPAKGIAPDHQYVYAERVMQLAAEQYNNQTGESIAPRQMQSILWGIQKRNASRSKNQKRHQGGHY